MSVLLFIRDLIAGHLRPDGFSVRRGVRFRAVNQLPFPVHLQVAGKGLRKRGVYLVAWLGTPLHELGHALFCLIFRHKIEDIKFFKPDKVNGTLGYVYHTLEHEKPVAHPGQLLHRHRAR